MINSYLSNLDEQSRQAILQASSRRGSSSLQKYCPNGNSSSTEKLPQVGGVSSQRAKDPFLALPPHFALKPLNLEGKNSIKQDLRGFRELAFYELIAQAVSAATSKEHEGENSVPIAQQKKEVELLQRLLEFIPPYYGIAAIQTEHPSPLSSPTNIHHLILHDITRNYSKPCIIDLKIGTKTYSPLSSMKKKQREISKFTLQETLGFRIVGMRVYCGPNTTPVCDEEGYCMFDKYHGRNLRSRKEVLDTLGVFFSGFLTDKRDEKCEKRAKEMIRKNVIEKLLKTFSGLEKLLQDNDLIKFYSSSILIVYEGNSAITEEKVRDRASLHLIDFAHVVVDDRTVGNGFAGMHESGILHGLEIIMGMLEDLLLKAKGEI